ncbi:MAG: GLPGLI family protein [Sediminibacterium sp.]|jgi:GLPGLI family protein
MKKIIFSLLLITCASISAIAQMKEGKISYERKVNMHRFITDPEMRARIPEFRTDKFELLFTEQASLFRTVVDDEAPDPFANNGGDRGGMRFNFRMPETSTYTDINTQMQYESRAMFEKTFLVVDSLKQNKWKISGETKTIAKYLCKKATTMVAAPQQVRMRFGNGPRAAEDTAAPKPKEVELVVWYTEDIPVSVGPDNYAGLPGAILEVDTDNGSNVIMATEVSTKFPKKELVQPTKGDKMNRAQFQDAMKKIMEDMQRGGGMGGIRISRGGN